MKLARADPPIASSPVVSMPGTLYLVATPIGNLEDITLRALRVLREVDVIAAEDTRHTAKLLTHYGIKTPLLSFHAHSGPRRTDEVLRRLHDGESVALVSDAGTPLVSDPGLELVQAARSANVPIDPIPGASAITLALCWSGFPLEGVIYWGFCPRKVPDRTRWLEGVAEFAGTQVFFESPHRIRETLAQAVALLGERQIFVAREMTKMHAESFCGTCQIVAGLVSEPKGEFTVVVGPVVGQLTDAPVPETASVLADSYARGISSGLSRREALAAAARLHGVSTKEVYTAVEAFKRPAL